MRSLVLSDIHANIEALEAVLAEARAGTYDRVLVLGDLVGYGASPNEVVERIRSMDPEVIIRGNHDKVASGLEAGEKFNRTALAAARWTFHTLTTDNREYLANLTRGPVQVDDLVEVCHGTPYDEDEYVFDDLDAAAALESASRPICFFGHTHVPVVYSTFATHPEAVEPDAAFTRISISRERSYLINPGSVGQPRNGDIRAAFAALDDERGEVTLFRVAYPVETAQAKIVRAGLPASLAKRLGMGK